MKEKFWTDMTVEVHMHWLIESQETGKKIICFGCVCEWDAIVDVAGSSIHTKNSTSCYHELSKRIFFFLILLVHTKRKSNDKRPFETVSSRLFFHFSSTHRFIAHFKRPTHRDREKKARKIFSHFIMFGIYVYIPFFLLCRQFVI